MAKQTINIGASPNDGTGTPLRTAFDYTNQNFTELYTATGPSGNNIVVPGNATITGDLTVDTSTLKVDSTNNRVGIGTATPDNQLSVRAALVATIDVRGGVGGAGALQISGNGTTLGTTSFDLIQNSVGAIVYQRDALPLFFNVNGSERYAISSSGVATWSNVGGVAGTAMTLNSTGLGVGVTPSAGRGAIQLSAGVGFPATQVASSDANTLDDYEEGTWTIGLTFGGGSTGITTGANTGRYTKVGRQVTVIGYLSLTNKGSSTGAANITGLPFASPNNVDSFSAVSLRLDVISYTGTPQGLQLINSTKIELEKLSEAGVSSALTDANFSNTSSIMLESTYFV